MGYVPIHPEKRKILCEHYMKSIQSIICNRHKIPPDAVTVKISFESLGNAGDAKLLLNVMIKISHVSLVLGTDFTTKLRTLSYCCGILLAYGFSVQLPQNLRRIGINRELNKLVEDYAWEANYTNIMYTDNNPKARDNFNKVTGYRTIIEPHINRRTDNTIAVYAKTVDRDRVPVSANVGDPLDHTRWMDTDGCYGLYLNSHL